MILAAFRLERDRLTSSQSFGYERQLWPGRRLPFQQFTTKLGCPIEIGTTLTASIVKIIELYNREEPIVIERLAWQFGNQLYPYRVKYIRLCDTMQSEEPMLFLPNIGTIHKKLTGLDIDIISPLEFYLDRAVTIDPRIIPSSIQTYIHSLCHKHRLAIDGLAPQQTDPLTLRDFLTVLDCENPFGFEQFVMPKLAINDPISIPFINRSLDARHLFSPGAGGNPFDTSAVGPIQINHPEVTLCSPLEYHSIAVDCDTVSQQYSDVKLKYILSFSEGILDCITQHLVCRYVDTPNEELIAHYCASIVINVHGSACAQHPEWIEDNHIVTLEITYGDEALIEIYTIDHKCCLFALHLDLAMIALCCADVIPQVA
jgi:hypothetical protein